MVLSDEKIIAVGLLTQRDLDVLGGGFQRLFPITADDMFADLLHRLEGVAAVPLPPRPDAVVARTSRNGESA